MDVINYLNANIKHFNVDLLEYVFELQSMGSMLNAKDTSDFLHSVEENVTITPIVIKKEPVPRELQFLYFVDLTESSDDTEGRFPSRRQFATDSQTVTKTGRKRKQRAKERSSETSSAKKRSKSQKPKVTKKLEQIILMSTQSK